MIAASIRHIPTPVISTATLTGGGVGGGVSLRLVVLVAAVLIEAHARTRASENCTTMLFTSITLFNGALAALVTRTAIYVEGREEHRHQMLTF